MNHLSPPPSQQYFMPDPHHLLDTSSYFDCYHPHPQQHHLQYPIPTVSTSSTEVSTSSLLPTPSSHFTSSSGAPPYEHLSPPSSSSHILITPPSVIPSLSPISSPTLSTFGFQMADYSIEQMEAIATSLFQARDGERLVSFFNQLKAIYGATALNQIVSEPILVAYTYALYHSNDFEQLFNLLATHSFQHIYFNDLQDIWHHARYRESQLKRGKELNPVEKYRLRRKFPPPKTIWDGEETVYSFKDSSRKYLKKFFQEITQYPSQEQKREISKHTGLKIVQISNWFKNRRQRDKTDNADRSPPSSSSSTNGSNNEFPPLAMNTQNINFVGVPFNVQHMNMFFDPN